ncbi:Gfo/Idh/MocA family protein [Caldicellulosiruptoraceae bacterium PP1]
MEKVKVGIIGCGNISGIYLKNCTKLFNILEVKAVSDIIKERAIEKAKEYNIPNVYTVEELLNDDEIKIVINLTIPNAHYEVCKKALEAGKHVYVEKPLSITREQGQELLNLSKEKGLRIGCAPDTFLGGGIQTCRKIIDDGWIGDIVAATAFMVCHGHESWHPDPEFYYKIGGGPMFDMGPYYLTALINLIGPIRRVTGSARISFAERLITSQKKYGTKIEVEVPTHIAGVMDFENGAIGTIITSFDVWSSTLPCIEIYGSEGTLRVPDPNTFGGPIYLRLKNSSEWKEIPLVYGYSENSRGFGVTDMAYAILEGREHRANGDLAYHVLDVMHGFIDSSNTSRHYLVESFCNKPEALPLNRSNY